MLVIPGKLDIGERKMAKKKKTVKKASQKEITQIEIIYPACEESIRIRIDKGKGLVGTLIVNSDGIAFRPPNCKRSDDNIIKWDVLTKLTNAEIFG